MNRSAAVTRIQRIFGGKTTHSTEIIDALQDVQVELEEGDFLPWFLKTDAETTAVTVADTRTVALPTNWLRMSEDDALYYKNDDSEYIPLEKHELSFLHNEYKAEEGAPEAFHTGLTKWHIFPMADAVYNLSVWEYYAKDTTLGTDVENQWLKYSAELMIGMAGVRVEPIFRDPEAVKRLEKMIVRGRSSMITSSEARKHAGKRYIMGGSD